MEPYQERVVAEKAELDERINKLCEFLASNMFNKMPMKERNLLIQQHQAMLVYSFVLRERIIAF